MSDVKKKVTLQLFVTLMEGIRRRNPDKPTLPYYVDLLWVEGLKPTLVILPPHFYDRERIPPCPECHRP